MRTRHGRCKGIVCAQQVAFMSGSGLKVIVLDSLG